MLAVQTQKGTVRALSPLQVATGLSRPAFQISLPAPLPPAPSTSGPSGSIMPGFLRSGGAIQPAPLPPLPSGGGAPSPGTIPTGDGGGFQFEPMPPGLAGGGGGGGGPTGIDTGGGGGGGGGAAPCACPGSGVGKLAIAAVVGGVVGYLLKGAL